MQSLHHHTILSTQQKASKLMSLKQTNPHDINHHKTPHNQNHKYICKEIYVKGVNNGKPIK